MPTLTSFATSVCVTQSITGINTALALWVIRVNGRNAGFDGLRMSIALALNVVESPPIRVTPAGMLPSHLRCGSRQGMRYIQAIALTPR